MYAHHRDHQLSICSDTEDLATVVLDHLTGAISAGEAALIVFGDGRRKAIVAKLAAAGFDVAAMEATGAIVQADTEDVLRAVVVDGRLDAAALEDLLATAWGLAATGGRRVHMVTDAADTAWRTYGRPVAEAIEHAADAVVAECEGTLLCNYAADLLDVMDERAEATIRGHGGTCITVARDHLDVAMAKAFDARFGAGQRRQLQAGEGPYGGHGIAERLVFWVRQKHPDELDAFLAAARADFERLREAA